MVSCFLFLVCLFFFFFKQKTAYEMRISDWSSDVCSSDLEMNLKLFGQRNGGRYVEHNVDGLLRGDFKTRMEGLAIGVQNSLISPDEARALENRPAKGRSEERRVGKEGVSTCRSRWSPHP